jgi:hypothetical protein
MWDTVLFNGDIVWTFEFFYTGADALRNRVGFHALGRTPRASR